MSSKPRLALSPRLDPELLRPILARHGRAHMPGILTAPSAIAVHDALAAHDRWYKAMLVGEVHRDVELKAYEGLAAEQRRLLADAVEAPAVRGFGYRFDSFKVSDLFEMGERSDTLLDELFALLNSEVWLGFIRAVTGDPSAVYCDAQATRYRSGDFLTDHTDDVPEKARLYAYVLNFTPAWRPDWGGILQFYDADGHVAEGYTPAFNALNIFKVPAHHGVSYVAPYAGADRLSVTGWIRAHDPRKA